MSLYSSYTGVLVKRERACRNYFYFAKIRSDWIRGMRANSVLIQTKLVSYYVMDELRETFLVFQKGAV